MKDRRQPTSNEKQQGLRGAAASRRRKSAAPSAVQQLDEQEQHNSRQPETLNFEKFDELNARPDVRKRHKRQLVKNENGSDSRAKPLTERQFSEALDQF